MKMPEKMTDFVIEKQCDHCIHNDVCAHKKDFEMVHEVIFNSVNVSIIKSSDFLDSIEVWCKFYQSCGIPSIKLQR